MEYQYSKITFFKNYGFRLSYKQNIKNSLMYNLTNKVYKRPSHHIRIQIYKKQILQIIKL